MNDFCRFARNWRIELNMWVRKMILRKGSCSIFGASPERILVLVFFVGFEETFR